MAKNMLIAKFDHDDVNILCGKRQKEYGDDCCDGCPVHKEDECKGYLFKQRDRLNSIIEETFGNDIYEKDK